MKGLALYRMKDKDSYDIYAVAGFYNGGPKQASKAFTETIKAKKGPEKATLDSLEEIKNAFASTTTQGPIAVARFIGTENARTDSYLRIKTFLENLTLTNNHKPYIIRQTYQPSRAIKNKDLLFTKIINENIPSPVHS